MFNVIFYVIAAASSAFLAYRVTANKLDKLDRGFIMILLVYLSLMFAAEALFA
jgi:hypothetical protein